MRRGIRGVVSLVLATLLLACGAGGPAPESESGRPWGAGAEEWLANVEEAGSEGVPNLEPFFAPDVVLDHRATGGGLARGLRAGLAMTRAFSYAHPDLILERPPYLSRTGLLVPASWGGPGLFSVMDAALVLHFSPRRLVREEALPSLVSGADALMPRRDWSAALELVDRYLRDRNQDGVRLVVQSLGPGRGPAVFAAPDRARSEGFRQVVALLRSTETGECPGRVAVSLRPGRTTGPVVEQYHRVDDGRRCLHGASRYDGWWSGATVPDPVRRAWTGTVTVEGVEVEIWNGTPTLKSLVGWALGRFREAGLEVPAVASVTFYPDADRCQGNLAVASGTRRDVIVVCFGEDLACTTSPCPPWSSLSETVMLHELAHTWLRGHVGADVRAAYEQLVGLRWEDPADPWESRALERASEVIAQGVRAELVPHTLLEIPRASLAAEFIMLTGLSPPPPAPTP